MCTRHAYSRSYRKIWLGLRSPCMSVPYLAEEGLGKGGWILSDSSSFFRVPVSGRQIRGETDRGLTRPRSSSSLYFLSNRIRRAVSLSSANCACSRVCWACNTMRPTKKDTFHAQQLTSKRVQADNPKPKVTCIVHARLRSSTSSTWVFPGNVHMIWRMCN